MQRASVAPRVGGYQACISGEEKGIVCCVCVHCDQTFQPSLKASVNMDIESDTPAAVNVPIQAPQPPKPVRFVIRVLHH